MSSNKQYAASEDLTATSLGALLTVQTQPDHMTHHRTCELQP